MSTQHGTNRLVQCLRLLVDWSHTAAGHKWALRPLHHQPCCSFRPFQHPLTPTLAKGQQHPWSMLASALHRNGGNSAQSTGANSPPTAALNSPLYCLLGQHYTHQQVLPWLLHLGVLPTQLRHGHVPRFRNLSISSSMLSIMALGSHLSPVNFRPALMASII